MSSPIDEAELSAFVDLHQEAIRYHYAGSTVQKAESVVQHYRHVAEQSLFHVREFKTELLISLRALSMVAESVGDAATHAEKAARVRGMVGIIETAIERVSKYDIEISRHSWAWDSVFRSDYPAREYVRRIHDLEETVRNLTAAESAKKRQEPGYMGDISGNPFGPSDM